MKIRVKVRDGKKMLKGKAVGPSGDMTVEEKITGPGNGVGPEDKTVTGKSVGKARVGKKVYGDFGQ